jgi:thioredoxin 1
MPGPPGTFPWAMSSEQVLEITEQNFAATTLGSPIPVLVDFTAVWCAPCRAIAPHIETIARNYAGRVRVGKCDVDGEQQLAARLGVRSMPTVIIWRNGQVVGQIVGAVPRAKIEALVESALATTSAPVSQRQAG